MHRQTKIFAHSKALGSNLNSDKQTNSVLTDRQKIDILFGRFSPYSRRLLLALSHAGKKEKKEQKWLIFSHFSHFFRIFNSTPVLPSTPRISRLLAPFAAFHTHDKTSTTPHSDGLWACWVFNPTYPLCHFFMHSTIGVLSSARRLVILFFRMGIMQAL